MSPLAHGPTRRSLAGSYGESRARAGRLTAAGASLSTDLVRRHESGPDHSGHKLQPYPRASRTSKSGHPGRHMPVGVASGGVGAAYEHGGVVKGSSRSAPTVVYHVGAHKTGTSLVQAFLRARRPELARQGADFVTRGAMSELFQWGRRLLVDPGPLAERIARTADDPAYRLLILSHENTLDRPFVPGRPGLYPRTGEIAAALRPVLADYDHRIVLSVRPPADFVESYYLQTIHEGAHHTFDRWLARVDPDALSWRPIVQTLKRTFGRDRVHVVDFRLIRQGQRAFLDHFLHVVDPGLRLDTEYDTVANASLSEKGLQMALGANPHLKNSQERGQLRVFLRNHFSNQRYPRPVLLNDDQRRSLQDRYDGEYEQMVAAEPASRQ